MPTELSLSNVPPATATARTPGGSATATTVVVVHPQTVVRQVEITAEKLPPMPMTKMDDGTIPTMEEFRDLSFRDQTVARLRSAMEAGMAPEEVLQMIAQEQAALAAAATDPNVINAAAALYFNSKQALLTDPAIAITSADAHETMQQILYRRAEEAKGYAALAASPEFAEEMISVAKNPNAPHYTNATLAIVKLDEMREELLHADANGAPQVLAHLDASRDGTVLTHTALAHAFTPDGPLFQPLLAAMANAAPGADPMRLQIAAAGWLNDRQSAAATTVAMITNDGPAYKLAAAESIAHHRATMNIQPPAPTHAARALVSKSELVMNI